MSNQFERVDGEPPTHPTSVALSRPPAQEVDAGTDIVLRVKVACPHGCDLRGRVVNVVALDGTIAADCTLADFVDDTNETTEFAFKAPPEVGEYSWTVVFPEQGNEGLVHGRGSLPMTVRTMAHDTSLAVWGFPSPIVMEHPFRIHVGATCSAGCNLNGKEIQICDETGASIARGRLGETPLEGTRALYWTEVDLVAPAREGATSRSIAFAPTELHLPHGGASARFGFETVKPPQYSVTVKVVEKDAGTPVEDAQVRLGVYFAYSDQTGLTMIAVPQGTYSLDVLKTGYEAPSQVLEVNDDETVQVEVAVRPPENPDAYWLFDPTKPI
jgi:PEGA domain-containing protein